MLFYGLLLCGIPAGIVVGVLGLAKLIQRGDVEIPVRK